MAQTVVIHHPAKAGSTMRVTAKAFRAAYASDGFVEGVREGETTPALDHHHAADLKRTEAQLAAVQQQLRDAQAERDAIAAQHATPPPAMAAAASPAPPAATPTPAPPRTDNPPAATKRAPRKRNRPTKATATQPTAPVTEPSPGPPDIGSKPTLD